MAQLAVVRGRKAQLQAGRSMAAGIEVGGKHPRNPEPSGCSAGSTQTLESCDFNIQAHELDDTTSSTVLDMLHFLIFYYYFLDLEGLPSYFGLDYIQISHGSVNVMYVSLLSQLPTTVDIRYHTKC